MATYMGLAVPLYPDTSGIAMTLTAGGAFDITATSPGADNLLAITATDGSTVTSGYLQPFYTNITLSSAASWSTGNAQINAFATDITLSGTVACEVEGMYVYIAGSSPDSLASANISGYVAYIADLGAAPLSRAGIQIHIEDSNTASGQDAAVLVRLEGSSSTLTNLIQLAGTATKKPAYFLATNQGAAASTFIQAFTAGGTQDKVLVCNVNGSTYWIPMYAASA